MSNKRLFKLSNLIVLLVVAGFAVLVWQSLKREPKLVLEQVVASEPQTLLTGYVQQASFELPFAPEAIALHEATLYFAADTLLYACTLQGGQTQSIVVTDEVLDLRVSAGKLYVLHPASITVYNSNLSTVGGWAACDDNSVFGQLAIAGEKVYVTDSNNKLVWRFSAEGAMEGQIINPTGFIVPGYQFAVTVANDTLYCANPGTHQVERYTLAGKYIDAFGAPGTDEGLFAGCCNPCGIVVTERGDLFTAEKGIARVCAYSKTGTYRGTLLSNRQLGGESVAPLICGEGNTLVVAHSGTVRVFGLE